VLLGMDQHLPEIDQQDMEQLPEGEGEDMAAGGSQMVEWQGPSEPEDAGRPVAVAQHRVGVRGEREFHEVYEGLSEGQFAEWRTKFDQRIQQADSRSLMPKQRLQQIHQLLSEWDTISPKERRERHASADVWKKKYEVGPDGVLYRTAESGNLVCVPKEELFDYLVPLHFAGAFRILLFILLFISDIVISLSFHFIVISFHFILLGNHCKGLLTYKRATPLYYHVTKATCIALCADCPEFIQQAEVRKPRAGGTPIITQGYDSLLLFHINDSLLLFHINVS
jgi:hypothetical protein